jgi:hypothetical protein
VLHDADVTDAMTRLHNAFLSDELMRILLVGYGKMGQ